MGRQVFDGTLVAALRLLPSKSGAEGYRCALDAEVCHARPLPGGKPGIDIAIPSFGYKSSIAICRRYGFIRPGKATDGARFDGRMLRGGGQRQHRF